jgi:hypothetical protein
MQSRERLTRFIAQTEHGGNRPFRLGHERRLGCVSDGLRRRPNSNGKLNESPRPRIANVCAVPGTIRCSIRIEPLRTMKIDPPGEFG